MARNPIYRNEKPLNEKRHPYRRMLLALGVLIFLMVFIGSVMGTGLRDTYAAPQTPVDAEAAPGVIPDTGGSRRQGVNEMREGILCVQGTAVCPTPTPTVVVPEGDNVQP